MIKKNLGLCLILILLLSGCRTSNENIVKNQESNKENLSENNQETNFDNKNEADSKNNQESSGLDKIKNDVQNEKKLAEVPVSNVTYEMKTFTPLIVSNISSLSTEAIPWSWLYSPTENVDLLAKYKGYGFGDTSKKIIYLTFDEGYENGYTSSILDTLKANNVHAAFFVTKPYVTGSFNDIPDSELLERMSSEGHIIGNHSVHHKSMPTFRSEEAFNAELIGVESAVNNIPGCKMSKYFRPPEGTFSELSLYYTQKLGYKSIFFAFAYQDYNVDNQPSSEAAKEKILKNTRDGMICLLHAVSKTNATILDDLIKEWKNRGYEFRSLDDLPS